MPQIIFLATIIQKLSLFVFLYLQPNSFIIKNFFYFLVFICHNKLLGNKWLLYLQLIF